MTGPDDFHYRRLDDVIHGRVRLAVMAYISGAQAADFSELKARLGVSDGNLGIHLRKLEEAGYLTAEKKFIGRKPQTTWRMTPRGAAAWADYVRSLAELLGRS